MTGFKAFWKVDQAQVEKTIVRSREEQYTSIYDFMMTI